MMAISNTKPVTVELQLVQTTYVNEETGQDEDHFYLELRESSRKHGYLFSCTEIEPAIYARLKERLGLEDE